MHVWRRDAETWLQSCLEKKNPDKTAGSVESVMFWRCITFVDVGTFVPVDGNINSQKDT